MKPLRIALSIDFDFFSAEDPTWDFGHTENSAMYQSSAIWAMRYLHIDLEKEASIDKADFYPLDILKELKKKNLNLMDTAHVGLADSHKYALDFFSPNLSEIDLIVNIDAHHDCWPYENGEKIDCGNWLTAIGKKTTWVYPKWKDPMIDVDPAININAVTWKDFKIEEPNNVVSIFVCRSSAWVPPHFDNLYARFVEKFSDNFYPVILQGVQPREDLEYEALAVQREAMQKRIGEINTHPADNQD
jgi:hypothetical protein